MDGKMLNETMSRRTGEIVFDDKTVDLLVTVVEWFTRGTVMVGREGPSGRYLDEVFPADRRGRCAYLIGATQEYARVSGALVPDELAPFLRDVQEAYRGGVTDRYGEAEAAGAEQARIAWKARTVRPRVVVTDRLFPKNSFESSARHIFPLLWEVGDMYGMDVVQDNWDALLNYQRISYSPGKGHTVLIQLHRK